MKRKLVRLMLIGITAIALTGCANLQEVIPPTPDEQIEEYDDEDSEDDDAEEDADDNDSSEIEDETEPVVKYILSRTPQSETFYYYNGDSLKMVDRMELAKETGTLDSDKYRIYSDYEYTMSALVGEGDGFLFFMDRIVVEFGNTSRAIVYAVREDDHKIYDVWQGSTDGRLESCEYYNGCMYIDYILGYDDSYNSLGEAVACYRYDEKSDSFVEEDIDPGLDSIINTINDSGAHLRVSGNLCSAHVYDDCDYLPAVLDGELILVNSNGKVHRIDGMSDAYSAYYDREHIFTIIMDYETYEGKAYVYDIRTDELTEVSDERGAGSLLGKCGTKYYFSVSDSEIYGITHNSIYEYDSDTGELNFIYDKTSVPGSSIIPGVEGFTVTEKSIYYIDFHDGDIIWKTVSLANPATPTIDLDLDREKRFDYGTFGYVSTSISCPDCSTDLIQAYSEYLILDGSISDHADVINEYLMGKAEEFNEIETTSYTIDTPCEDHQAHPTWYRVTNDYYVSDIDIICDNYLTVNMTGYWYGGGAHGMPYRGQYLFDLTTGEAKSFTDFYEGTESEFKSLVAEKTKEDFLGYDLENYGSPYFSADADEIYDEAYEYASLDGGTIEFTSDGIIFYYPPYEMGPYASGFIDIFISYEELLGRATL